MLSSPSSYSSSSTIQPSWWDLCTSNGSITSIPPPSSPRWIHVVYMGDILYISKSSFTSYQVLSTWLRHCVHGQGIFCFGNFSLTHSMNSSTPTTRNIHFYDENLNDELETDIEELFLWRIFPFHHRSMVMILQPSISMMKLGIVTKMS